MKRSKALTEGALLTALYLILLFITIYMPFIGFFSMFLLSIPFVIYASRHGLKSSLLMCLAALLLSSFYIIALPVTLLMALGGIALGTSIHAKQTAYETWVRGTVGFVVGFLVVYILSQWMFSMNWVDEITKMLHTSFNMIKDAANSLNGGEAVKQQLSVMEDQLKQVPYLIPSSLVISSVLFAFISQWISYKIMNRIDKQKYSFPPFSEFKIPTSIIWYYFFSIIIMWIDPSMESIWNQAAVNVYALTGMLLLLQGFSFIFYFAKIKNYAKGIPITVVIITFLLSFLLLHLVRILGIIDIGFDLRNRMKNKE